MGIISLDNYKSTEIHWIALYRNNNNNSRKEANKIVSVAWSKLYSIENKLSKALMNNKITHEDFTTIMDEKYHKLEESIRMIRSGK